VLTDYRAAIEHSDHSPLLPTPACRSAGPRADLLATMLPTILPPILHAIYAAFCSLKQPATRPR